MYWITKRCKQITYVLSVILLVTSCGERPGSQGEQPVENLTKEGAIPVLRKEDLALEQVVLKNATVYASITGRIIPKNSTDLVSEVQGRILPGTQPFKAGTRYAKGDVLMRVDSEEFRLSLIAQKSAFLNLLTAAMPDLKADYADNYDNWLAFMNSLSLEKALPKLPEAQSASEKYFISSSDIYRTYYDIKSQEVRLSKYTIKAPFSGSLNSSLIDAGGLISVGQSLGTFMSDPNYEIEAGINVKLASQLTVGRVVAFYNKELNKTYEAKVVRVNNMVDTNTQNIPVYFTIADPSLKSGMYVEGQLKTEEFENAFTISKALVNRDLAVHVLDQQTIKKKPVAVLSSSTDSLIVAGLNQGDLLVTKSFDMPIVGLKISNP